MYLVLGLGNPGKEYEFTRHNAGFLFLDKLAMKYNIKINKIKFKGLCGEGTINGEKVVLIKPSTYMNKSGECLIEAMNFYKVNASNIIVVYDDVSLELGKIRIRRNGSAGGHNGIKNIIYLSNTDIFDRIKIGVNSPHNENIDLTDFVLGRFSNEELKEFSLSVDKSILAIEHILKNETSVAMNNFN
jgi:PTH1 family peptidyl-tRNA hydrolase